MKQIINYFHEKIDDNFPFTYIDVGAMGGIPLKWSCMLDIMNVIAFEPDQREFSKLKSENNIKYLDYVLNDRQEDLKYYITRDAGKSSVLKPNIDILSQYENDERFQVIEEEIISSERIRNLDCVIEENSIKDVDFIKLDTQGSELRILQGGQRRLVPMIFGAQIEVEFVEMYKQQPLFRNIDEFLDNEGFALIDLRRQYWKRRDYYNYRGKGQLIFGDALYFKKLEHFCQELSGIEDKSYGKAKIYKSILVCMVYEMFDYAVAVAKVGLDLGYLDEIEYEKTISEIKRDSFKGMFYNSQIYAWVYSKIKSLLQKYKPRSYLGWADSDGEIGNIKDI